jgi:hypothetical protein
MDPETKMTKVTRRLKNGRTRVFYRYANGVESGEQEGVAEFFWPQVAKQADGCWLWRGRTNNNHNTLDCKSYDYGVFRLVSGYETGAHRAAIYFLTGTLVPDDAVWKSHVR